MTSFFARLRPRAVAAAVFLAACAAGPAPVTVPDAAAAAAGHTPADVAFMQHMIAHHAQAVEMAALVPGRTETRALLLLAERVAVSQEDEMALMRRGLSTRGEAAPDAHAHHGAHAGMPGMLPPERMAALASARGAEFDRRFLEAMIFHHEGAIEMVEALFAAGGGQETEIFQFASHVDSDQRMEIERMRRMLR